MNLFNEINQVNKIYKEIWKKQDEASSTTLNRFQYEEEIKALYKQIYELKGEQHETN
jgi:peptidoglycan hydrolase CwlO-like protein